MSLVSISIDLKPNGTSLLSYVIKETKLMHTICYFSQHVKDAGQLKIHTHLKRQHAFHFNFALYSCQYRYIGSRSYNCE